MRNKKQEKFPKFPLKKINKAKKKKEKQGAKKRRKRNRKKETKQKEKRRTEANLPSGSKLTASGESLTSIGVSINSNKAAKFVKFLLIVLHNFASLSKGVQTAIKYAFIATTSPTLYGLVFCTFHEKHRSKNQKGKNKKKQEKMNETTKEQKKERNSRFFFHKRVSPKKNAIHNKETETNQKARKTKIKIKNC